MLRPRSLLLAAALFAFSSSALGAAPACAAEASPAIEATYAGVLQTINPKLPLAKARSYARSVMADAWRTFPKIRLKDLVTDTSLMKLHPCTILQLFVPDQLLIWKYLQTFLVIILMLQKFLVWIRILLPR
jgi:hypothetical protein